MKIHVEFDVDEGRLWNLLKEMSGEKSPEASPPAPLQMERGESGDSPAEKSDRTEEPEKEEETERRSYRNSAETIDLIKRSYTSGMSFNELCQKMKCSSDLLYKYYRKALTEEQVKEMRAAGLTAKCGKTEESFEPKNYTPEERLERERLARMDGKPKMLKDKLKFY
ncbi:MAG: hypothetical protein LBR08_10440 [Bacteroidales bacterium]|jgi:hypothetical protein|nr:hypothetical protein [Bacteroidales bacterium]